MPGLLLSSLVTLAALLAGTFLYLTRVVPSRWSHLPGPPPTHPFFGSFFDLFGADPLSAPTKWIQQYGRIFVVQQILGEPNLFVADPRAVAHIFEHSETFRKPQRSVAVLEAILGGGILVSEGDVHRRHRRVLGPAFTAAAIDALVPEFLTEAWRMRDRLLAAGKEVDMLSQAATTALRVMRICGLGEDPEGMTDELGRAYRDLVDSRTNLTPVTVLQLTFPLLQRIPTKAQRTFDSARAIVIKAARHLVADAKDASTGLPARSMLGLVIRANTDPDLPPKQRLSDEEVAVVVQTLLFAGHETTASAIAWGLYRLAHAPDIQIRLRGEVQAAPSNPTAAELNDLPLLAAVVREILRLDAPVVGTHREAMETTHLPLSKPLDTPGGPRDTIHVPKGTALYLPYGALNRLPEVWGPTAAEFDPDRFERDGVPSKGDGAIGAPYGNLYTFLSGPHSCLGFRFAVAEIKAVLFVLLRELEFMPGDEEVVARALLTSRPHVMKNGKAVPGLPMRVGRLEV